MDKYDKAIEFLTANPEEIYVAWLTPYQHPGGILFQHTGTQDGYERNDHTESGTLCGCLTMVRKAGCAYGRGRAYNQEITNLIRADDRIPFNPEDVQLSDLPVFAEWQRKLDKMIPGRII